jgi:hypothetical protein
MAMAPPTQKQFHPEAMETVEQTEARYHSIAEDIATVVWNPSLPPLFSGVDGRAKTASVVESIMSYESGFRRDVDFGLGAAGKGDGGHSWCLMQVRFDHDGDRTATWNKVKGRFKMQGDPEDELVQGWTGEELVQDRKKCIEAGYRVMKVSFSMCRSLPVSAWLRAYASGNCEDDGGGAQKSESRMNRGINWFNRHQPGFHDAQILFAITTQHRLEEEAQLLTDDHTFSFVAD